MEKELKDQLVRVLDMTEAEMRASLICILKDIYDREVCEDQRLIVKRAIDAAYNNARRTGLKSWS